MFKNKYIKIAVSSFLVLMALWIAVPKVYIHDLLHHDHTPVSIGSETKINSQSTDDCEFDKYNKPAYFSIFKFISSFIPTRTKNESKIVEKILHLSKISYAISLLRGPPVTN